VRKVKTLAEKIISDKWVNWAIGINAACLLLNEFPSVRQTTGGVLQWVDFGCILYFVAEAALKIQRDRTRGYFQKNWNKFDFAVTLISLPALAAPFFPETNNAFVAASILRASRAFRFFRLMKFIPNIERLLAGVNRAIRASCGIFIALAILNVILALIATIAFGEISQEHFGNPLRSSYSLLKIFTVEGWYEIPEAIATQTNQTVAHALHGFVIVAVIIGGILGMGLANAVFVDEMTADNTQKVEQMVAAMHEEIKTLRREMNSERNQEIGKETKIQPPEPKENGQKEKRQPNQRHEPEKRKQP
jgi:voltage-gated sodium channel